MSIAVEQAVVAFAARHNNDRLRLSAIRPEAIAAGRSTATLDVRVSNVSGERLRAMTAIAASVVVVEHGVVVGLPLPVRDVAVVVDLAPGESKVFRSGADLYRCSTGVGLPPGRYALYAAQRFTLLDADGGVGETLELQTGPWPLQLR